MSASLSRVTCADQRFPPRFRDFNFVRRFAIALSNARNLAAFRALHELNFGLKFDGLDRRSAAYECSGCEYHP